MPDGRLARLDAGAGSSGMPTVGPRCWELVTSPVARPCSPSGSPEVAVTPYETIAHRWPTQAGEAPVRASRCALHVPRAPIIDSTLALAA